MKLMYSKENLEKVSKISFSLADVLVNIGLVPIGGNYKTINKYLKLHGIDTSHFTGMLWNKGKTWINHKGRQSLDDILVDYSTFQSNHLKKKLFEEGVKEKQCEVCKNTEWLSRPIALELHHINGINTDNRITNLQILCPNCHAHTDNYRGSNMKNQNNKPKVVKIKRDKIEAKFCSCGEKMARRSMVCWACSTLLRRTVQRPDTQALLEELKQSSFTALGKKYNVSDNAIRKWIR